MMLLEFLVNSSSISSFKYAGYWLFLLLFIPFMLCFILFGFYKLWLLYLYVKSRGKKVKLPPQNKFPIVTFQLPIYNEYNVIERLVHSTTSMDYPREKIEIQILDDSTDETRALVDKIVEEKSKQGFNIYICRRKNREGFKAGALEEGLKKANGEFIAIFDADFIPSKDFLKKTLPYFEDPDVGLVQTKWGFINEEENIITKVQALSLNAHFEIEHFSKFRNGMFFNFNGTAGIWRKTCIISAGSWEYDTLAEDLDLSIRAYLKGWKFIYAGEVVSYSELPSSLSSFETQQFRWTKGTMEVAKKLFKRVWNSPLSIRDKINITLHIFSPFLYLANFLFYIFIWPLSYFAPVVMGITTFLFGSANLLNIFITDRILHPERTIFERLKNIFFVIVIFSGFCLKGTLAVFETMIGKKTPFVRTPKKGDKKKSYKLTKTRKIEVFLSLYYLLAIPISVKLGLFGLLPWTFLFFFSTLSFAFVILKEREIT